MARVTIEDCIERLPSRFELVMLAAQRARKIGSGAPLTIDRDNDKNPVVALREIAEETIDTDELKEDLTRSKQRIIAMDDEDEEDIIDMMDGEEEWGTLTGGLTAEGESAPQIEKPVSSSGASAETGAPTLEDLAGTPSE